MQNDGGIWGIEKAPLFRRTQGEEYAVVFRYQKSSVNRETSAPDNRAVIWYSIDDPIQEMPC